LPNLYHKPNPKPKPKPKEGNIKEASSKVTKKAAERCSSLKGPNMRESGSITDLKVGKRERERERERK
jgi:hypothetical protein